MKNILLIVLVLSLYGCDSDDESDKLPENPLDKLIGNVEITYRFMNGDHNFSQEAEFKKISSGSVCDAENKICCTTSTIDYEYFCLKEFESGAMTLFYFDLEPVESKEGAGIFEFCSADVSSSECAIEFQDPDGVAVVQVTKSSFNIVRNYSTTRNFIIEGSEQVEVYSLGLDMDTYSDNYDVELNDVQYDRIHKEILDIRNSLNGR